MVSELTFYSRITGATIHARMWPVDASLTATGVVVFLHGFGMHSGMPRYDTLRAACVARDLAFVAWDMPHHGTSSRLGGDHPLKALRVREPELVSDAVDLVALVRARFGAHVPVVLMGESLGGALALRVAPEALPAGVCTIAGHVRQGLHMGIPVLNAFVGGLTLLRATLAAPRHKQKEAFADPLIYTSGVPPLFTIARCARLLTQRTPYEDVTCPLHVCVGTRDLLYTPRHTFREAFARCTRVPVLRRTMDIVRGARHDSLVEDDDAMQACASFARDACERRVISPPPATITVPSP